MGSRAKLKKYQSATPIKVQQSNFITCAVYDYSLQEKRILYRVVQKAYEFRQANPHLFPNGCEGSYKTEDSFKIEMSVRDFMTIEQQKNLGGTSYKEVEDGFEALTKKHFRFENENRVSFGSIITEYNRDKQSGKIRFLVHSDIWNIAVNFIRGYTMLEIESLMQFKSVYSMRMYEFAKQWEDKGYWKVSLEKLREYLMCEKIYTKTAHFKLFVLDVAKKELDEKSPIRFTYITHKMGRKIEAFTFFFERNYKSGVITQTEEIKYLMHKNSPSMPFVRHEEEREFLKQKIGMTSAEINKNALNFLSFFEKFGKDSYDKMNEIYQWMKRKGVEPSQNKGYFIQSIKNATEES